MAGQFGIVMARATCSLDEATGLTSACNKNMTMETAAHFLRADDAGNVAANDIAVRGDGEVVESIVRYHDVLLGLAGRDGVRNDISRYEALALAMVDPVSRAVLDDWPSVGSPIRMEKFMDAIYRAYDQRYVYAAPKLAKRTARLSWRDDSPAFSEPLAAAFAPRLGL